MNIYAIELKEGGSAVYVRSRSLELAEYKARKMFGQSVASVYVTGFTSLEEAQRGGGESE